MYGEGWDYGRRPLGHAVDSIFLVVSLSYSVRGDPSTSDRKGGRGYDRKVGRATSVVFFRPHTDGLPRRITSFRTEVENARFCGVSWQWFFFKTRLFSGELLLCRVNPKMQFGRCLDHHGALGTSTIGFRSPRLVTRTKESNMYASIRERNPSKKNDTVRNESERWDAV